MGIPGLWEALTEAKHTQSLYSSALHDTDTGLKVAIDISIWSFQCATTPGGDNPELRTLYYRLCRLLNAGVKAIFVFDGPHKPAFKRGKKTSTAVRGLPTFKKLIGLFGFEIWEAPGEAEAECAHLQALGIVDAVLTEDVDALMFGASCVYRSWAAVDDKGNKSSTAQSHTLCYKSQTILEKCRLDPEGMILIAMLAGGDYIPAGVPKCGIKTAVEIAAAGFGGRLLKSLDDVEQWRNQLQESLRSNADGYFSRKHPGLQLPTSFPDLRILKYYTHPVVSSRDRLDEAKERFKWLKPIDIPALRVFGAEYFDWSGRIGDAKIVRTLAQPVLTQELCRQVALRKDGKQQEAQASFIENHERLHYPFTIHGSRQHISSGLLEELRVSVVPIQVVPIDLHEDEDIPTGHAILESLNDFESPTQLETQESPHHSPDSSSPSEKSCQFDFQAPLRLWILRSYLERAYPDTVKDWEKSLVKRSIRKSPTKGNKKLRNGTLDQFVTILKAPPSSNARSKETENSTNVGSTFAQETTRRSFVERVQISVKQSKNSETDSRHANTRANRRRSINKGATSAGPINLDSDEETSDVDISLTRQQQTVRVSSDTVAYTIEQPAPNLKNYFKSSKVLDTLKAQPRKTESKRIIIRKSLPGSWREADIGEEYGETLPVIDLT